MAGFLESIGNFLGNSAPQDGLPNNGYVPVENLGALGKIGYVLQSLNPNFQQQYAQGLAQRQQLGNEQKQLGFAENADIRAGLSAQREGEAFGLQQQARQNELKKQQALANVTEALKAKGITDPFQQLSAFAQVDPETYLPRIAQLQQEQQLAAQQNDFQRQRLALEQQRIKASSIPDLRPLSPEAQLASDLQNGFIDQKTYDRAIAKKVAPTDKNYKQYQTEAASFADRMAAASEELGNSSSGEGFSPTNLTSSALSNLGLDALANTALSPEQQRFKNASDEWIRAKLRKESGAAIGAEEMAREYRTYFPQVGDSKEVIKQKASLRRNAQESLVKESGGAFDDLYGGKPYQSIGDAPKGAPKFLGFE